MANLPQDPIMLMSVINMKLRDENETLDELCAREGLDRKVLETKLETAGFTYLPEANQFR